MQQHQHVDKTVWGKWLGKARGKSFRFYTHFHFIFTPQLLNIRVFIDLSHAVHFSSCPHDLYIFKIIFLVSLSFFFGEELQLGWTALYTECSRFRVSHFFSAF